jgi:hypothetical protein
MTGICWFDGQMRVDEINDTPRTDAFLENALSAIHETETLENFTRQLERELAKLRQMVAQQAEDDGLWFRAATAPEAYLQQELRRLHAAVEGAK